VSQALFVIAFCILKAGCTCWCIYSQGKYTGF